MSFQQTLINFWSEVGDIMKKVSKRQRAVSEKWTSTEGPCTVKCPKPCVYSEILSLSEAQLCLWAEVFYIYTFK